MLKKFMGMLLLGVAMELGTCLVKEGMDAAKDPYKRAVIKQRVNKIKDAFCKKEEEEPA